MIAIQPLEDELPINEGELFLPREQFAVDSLVYEDLNYSIDELGGEYSSSPEEEHSNANGIHEEEFESMDEPMEYEGNANGFHQGLATNSILFCWLFTVKDQCKKCF